MCKSDEYCQFCFGVKRLIGQIYLMWIIPKLYHSNVAHGSACYQNISDFPWQSRRQRSSTWNTSSRSLLKLYALLTKISGQRCGITHKWFVSFTKDVSSVRFNTYCFGKKESVLRFIQIYKSSRVFLFTTGFRCKDCRFLFSEFTSTLRCKVSVSMWMMFY